MMALRRIQCFENACTVLKEGGGVGDGVEEEIAKQMTWGKGKGGGGTRFFFCCGCGGAFFFFFAAGCGGAFFVLLRVRGRHAPGHSLTGAAPEKSTHSKKAPTTNPKAPKPLHPHIQTPPQNPKP